MIPVIIPRPQHNISRVNISEAALKVLYRLKEAGFQAHLVGGSVRDLLLGREPKDYDVATEATPEQVRAVFHNSRLIGRRFLLVHVQFGNEIVEVATFRGTGNDGTNTNTSATCSRLVENGMIVRDNVYGTIAEDALRRDFTINALYYSIADFSVLDFASGMTDLHEGILRLIGEPELRYREDPVRMLRALRFVCKLGFNLNPACEGPLWNMGHLLHSVPPARLFEEVLKLFLHGYGLKAFEKLRHYGLFAVLFPQTDCCLAHEEQEFPLTLISKGFADTDARIQLGKQVTPVFLFAMLLWEPVRLRQIALMRTGQIAVTAIYQAASEVLARQQRQVFIPKRFTMQVREIWSLQQRFELRRGKHPLRLISHPRFRAAYDFLQLRAATGEADTALAEWWSRYQGANAPERETMTSHLDSHRLQALGIRPGRVSRSKLQCMPV